MSAVYNPEAEVIAEIERLDLHAKDLRRRISNARNEEDRRVLNRQLRELQEEFTRLQSRLP
jgi:hypothetical protein